MAMFTILVLVACGSNESNNVVIVDEEVKVETGQTIFYELDSGMLELPRTNPLNSG
jgi:hypothetical protein